MGRASVRARISRPPPSPKWPREKEREFYQYRKNSFTLSNIIWGGLFCLKEERGATHERTARYLREVVVSDMKASGG